MNKSIYDFSLPKIDGKPTNLGDFKGKVLLLVNVASKCGLTPQYEALEKIYEQYQPQGFDILAFPANEFGAQEPGSNQEIQEFCQSKFGVKFTMFSKIVVKGSGQHPLYSLLTSTFPEAQKPADSKFEEQLKGYGITRENRADILWNFEKFLVGRDGKIIQRFSPDTKPDDPELKKAIEAALG